MNRHDWNWSWSFIICIWILLISAIYYENVTTKERLKEEKNIAKELCKKIDENASIEQVMIKPASLPIRGIYTPAKYQWHCVIKDDNETKIINPFK